MDLFHGWNSTVSMLQSHHQETVYFLPLSPEGPGDSLNIKIRFSVEHHTFCEVLRLVECVRRFCGIGD